MNSKLQNLIFFVTGVTIGSVATKIVLDKKYNKIIDEKVEEETRSIKEVFERDKEKFEEMKRDLKENYREENRQQVKEYVNKVTSYGYSSDVSNVTNRYKTYNDDTEIISSADSMDEAYNNYEHESLSYYADGVLATTNGDEMITEQEADQTIGRDIFYNLRDHFGEYPDDPDTVYVRNDENQIIYEIFRDSRTYMEVTEE